MGVVNNPPRPLYPRDGTPVPIERAAGWAPGPVRTSEKSKYLLPLPEFEPRTVQPMATADYSQNDTELWVTENFISYYDTVQFGSWSRTFSKKLLPPSSELGLCTPNMQQQSFENSVSTYHSNSEDCDSRFHRNVGNQQHHKPEDLKVVHPRSHQVITLRRWRDKTW